MIRFFAGLMIIFGVVGNDCNGKCDPSMDTVSMAIWTLIGVGLMLWSLPKLIQR
jgi:hypothetical protein